MLYKPIKIDVPEKYHERIKTALQAGKKVSVKVSLQSLDDGGGKLYYLPMDKLENYEKQKRVERKVLQ